jgi:protein-S-isoprenylcysteine O-methyltransferase Ste14
MPEWFHPWLVVVLFVAYTALRVSVRRQHRAMPAVEPTPPTTKISISPQSPRQSARVNQPNEGFVLRGLRWLLVGLFMVGTLLYVAVIPATQGAYDWARQIHLYTQIKASAWWSWVGLVLAVGGLGLLAWSHHALARFWSPEIQLRPDHQLIQHGPYKRIRHPMYTSLFCFFAGVSLISASLLLAVPAVWVSLYLAIRTNAEERLLTIHFGLPYREYAQVTGRFFPTLRRKKPAHRPRTTSKDTEHKQA